MNEPTKPDDGLSADEFLVTHGEQISAYVDGELPPSEAAEVERLLQENPAAAQLADELRSMGQVFQAEPVPVFTQDLSSIVVAEAQRRQAEEAVALADRLEPEGEFGLPFGKSSNNWMWAVFAAAAAVMIAFYGRPPQQAGGAAIANRASPQQIEKSLVAMQRFVPGMQVRQYQVTPSQLVQFQQRMLANRSAQPTQAPGALMAVSQSGVVVEPVGPTIVSTDASPDEPTEELICIDADDAELDRLLGELDGEVIRVESDRAEALSQAPAPAPQVATAPKPGIRGVWRLRLTPEAAAQLIAQQQAKTPVAGQRRLVILRIQVKPASP